MWNRLLKEADKDQQRYYRMGKSEGWQRTLVSFSMLAVQMKRKVKKAERPKRGSNRLIMIAIDEAIIQNSLTPCPS